jgi:hypothetical protein
VTVPVIAGKNTKLICHKDTKTQRKISVLSL